MNSKKHSKEKTFTKVERRDSKYQGEQTYKVTFFFLSVVFFHTAYSRNDMSQKCEGNCGLWVLNEMIKRMYPESLKKIVGAVWELPAK